MKKLLCTNRCNWGTLPIRIALGIVFMAHGSQKLFGAFGGPGLQKLGEMFQQQGAFTPGAFWATVVACSEFFGGVLVALGLLTRFGAFLLAVTMTVAIAKVHWNNGFFADKHGFEYPFALLGMALGLLISGGGAASADACMSGKCKSQCNSSEAKP